MEQQLELELERLVTHMVEFRVSRDEFDDTLVDISVDDVFQGQYGFSGSSDLKGTLKLVMDLAKHLEEKELDFSRFMYVTRFTPCFDAELQAVYVIPFKTPTS